LASIPDATELLSWESRLGKSCLVSSQLHTGEVPTVFAKGESITTSLFESFQVLDQRTITSRNYAVSLIFQDSEKSKLHMQNLNLKKL
jgi:hypothetical protein